MAQSTETRMGELFTSIPVRKFLQCSLPSRKNKTRQSDRFRNGGGIIAALRLKSSGGPMFRRAVSACLAFSDARSGQSNRKTVQTMQRAHHPSLFPGEHGGVSALGSP